MSDQPTLARVKWTCPACNRTFSIPAGHEVELCRDCEQRFTLERQTTKAAEVEPSGQSWACEICHTTNGPHSGQCSRCGSDRIVSGRERKARRYETLSGLAGFCTFLGTLGMIGTLIGTCVLFASNEPMIAVAFGIGAGIVSIGQLMVGQCVHVLIDIADHTHAHQKTGEKILAVLVSIAERNP